MSDREIPILPGKIYFYPCKKEEEYKSVFLPGTKKVHIKFSCTMYGNEDVFSNISHPQCLEDSYNLIYDIKEAVVSQKPGKQVLLFPLVELSIAPLFELVNQTLSKQLIKGKKYERLFDFVDKNLYVDTTIRKIAKETGYSTHVLTHTVPKEIGVTVKQYIVNRVLRMVCFDLVYTETLIRNIALKYHFASEGYFSNWFLKQTGQRPKDYRNSYYIAGGYNFYKTMSE